MNEDIGPRGVCKPIWLNHGILIYICSLQYRFGIISTQNNYWQERQLS